MSDDLRLKYRDKVLLFLMEYSDMDFCGQVPEDITQKGISDALGMSRTHTSRVLKRLKNDDLLKEELASVEGHERKLKSYMLTSKGVNNANEIFGDIKDIEVKVKIDDEIFNLTIDNILDNHGDNLDLVQIIEAIEENDLPLILGNVQERIEMIDEAPELSELVGREDELTEIERWFHSDIPVAILLGRRGYGASALARKFIEEIGADILWLKIEDRNWEDIEERIEQFLLELDHDTTDLIEGLFHNRVLVVFDDYYNVDDDLVDFLDECIDQCDFGVDCKLLITSRKGIPVYERFYSIQDVKNKMIKEIEISSLDREETQNLLGTNLKKDALYRVMLMTKGSPLILKLLKEGDRDELNKVSTLSKEQISLLMFLKNQSVD